MTSHPTSALLLSLSILLFLTTSTSSAPLHPTTRSTNGTADCEWLPPVSDRRDVTFKSARNVVFFTDGTNFDDVVTLLYLTKSRRVNLLAIYLQGNAWASPGSSFRNNYNMLHMMGPKLDNVPIYAGSYYAIQDELNAATEGGLPKLSYRTPVPFGSSGILFSDTMHGMAHFVPQSCRAYDIRTTPDQDDQSIPALFELLNSMPSDEPVTFLSVGTLTPIAKMFTSDYLAEFEEILKRVDGLYVMGGAVDAAGNLFSLTTNVKAEFNIYNDPHAAEWAFGNMSRRDIPVTLVPLDATDDVPIPETLLQALRFAPKTPEAQLTGRLMENLRDTWFAPELFFTTAFLWDPSAAIVMLHDKVVKKSTVRDLRVVIEEGPDGPNQGWTKPCTKKEVDAGLCYKINVVEDLKPVLVTKKLLDALQQSQNSAALPLVCL